MKCGIYVGKLDPKSLDFLLKSDDFDFVWVASDDKKALRQLKKKGFSIFFPLGVFSSSDDQEWDKFRAIDKSGKPIEMFAGWYRGTCPANRQVRSKRLALIKKIFKSPCYDGVWLDTIRYPTYWETKKPVYLDTCYCETCLREFKKSGLSWEKLRIKQIESFLEEVARAKGKKSLGYFAVPEIPIRLRKVFAQPPEIFKDKANFIII